jgi:CRP-like cAMP-binding protein
MVTIQTLANNSLFEGLPDDALTAIADLCHEESLASGTTICGEGRPADRVYLLQEGTVGLSVSLTSRPAPLTISMLKSPGQAFGWSAVVGSGYYTASAQAVTDVRIIAVDGHALTAYLEQNPAVGYEVMKRVAQVVSYRLGTIRKLLLDLCDEGKYQTNTRTPPV